jgi:hypothetical protein
MAMNRDKFRNIVGGITTPEARPAPLPPASSVDSAVAAAPVSEPVGHSHAKGQGSETNGPAVSSDDTTGSDTRRFAKRGRPKGRKTASTAEKIQKVKVSLFIDESITNDLYEWAHQDKLHPGEMFDQALRYFHKHEKKRRNAEKE